ncbi:hypothetical protein [Allokutzneria oryzae]|uniref:Uncharacterized protein n=1 Tax=Allokutzneria oryzae TaxID=1378989 RepID=A0ABV6A2Y9_9PSEU
MCGGAGFVLAGLAPADVNLTPHVIGAFLIMGAGNTGLALTGFARRGSQLWFVVLGARQLRSVTSPPPNARVKAGSDT